MEGIEVHSLSIATGDDGIVVRADLQAVTGDLETKLADVAERSEVEELDLGE